MNELPIGVLVTLIGVLYGVLVFVLRYAWNKIEKNDAEIDKIKQQCISCRSESWDALALRLSKMMDDKLDAWWSKIENNLMNDGRLPPKRGKRD